MEDRDTSKIKLATSKVRGCIQIEKRRKIDTQFSDEDIHIAFVQQTHMYQGVVTEQKTTNGILMNIRM